MEKCFNSKLVRLEESLPIPIVRFTIRFNSKLVRLEGHCTRDTPACVQSGFNSKLVRLEEY